MYRLKCFKKLLEDNIRRVNGEWMINGNKEKTPSGKVMHPSVELIYSWVLQSWNSKSNDINSKSLRRQVSPTL